MRLENLAGDGRHIGSHGHWAAATSFLRAFFQWIAHACFVSTVFLSFRCS